MNFKITLAELLGHLGAAERSCEHNINTSPPVMLIRQTSEQTHLYLLYITNGADLVSKLHCYNFSFHHMTHIEPSSLNIAIICTMPTS